MLPKTTPTRLPGTVLPQYVRCGKSNCRCAGGDLHGPYYYRFWRDDDGRLRKSYVRMADVDAVRAACEARQDATRSARTTLHQGRAALALLARGERARWCSLEDVTQFFASREAIQALLGLAADENADLLFRLRAFLSLAKARRPA